MFHGFLHSSAHYLLPNICHVENSLDTVNTSHTLVQVPINSLKIGLEVEKCPVYRLFQLSVYYIIRLLLNLANLKLEHDGMCYIL